MTVKIREELFKSTSVEELLGYASPSRVEVELKGKITRSLVEELSRLKKEPDWMRRLRLRSLELFEKLPMPNWLRGIEELDLEELAHYVKPDTPTVESWEEVPEEIRKYYERLGIPELEAKFLSGLSAQFESETIYSKIKEKLAEKGVIMLPMEQAVQKYPDLVKKYFLRVFSPAEHKFAALHGALWSGGVFVYVPPGVRVEEPLEAFFLIGRALEGQFEHTIVVADEGSYIHFIEGCAAPMYKGYSFHDGMVELYAHRNATIKFTTLQNWSKNVINFNNKRGIAEENAKIEWIEGSIGSKISYVYPSTVLKGRGASSRSIVVTIAKGPYLKDGGSKMIHAAPDTRSRVISKSISVDGGINIYRGLIRVNRGAVNARAHVECDSLILDDESMAYTYPHNQVEEPTAHVTHEATTGRLGEDQLFYLQSRGLSEDEAKSIIVLGFLDEIMIELPFEFANVLNKVIQLEFSKIGGVG